MVTHLKLKHESPESAIFSKVSDACSKDLGGHAADALAAVHGAAHLRQRLRPSLRPVTAESALPPGARAC